MSEWEEGGGWDIRVDTLGFLANNLRGYEPDSILREQLQNADDASYKQGRTGALELRFLADKLVVINPSVFTDEDWHRIFRPSSRGKFHDAEQTGEFGIGFWGSLHLTDAPLIRSGSKEVVLDPVGPRRRVIPNLDRTEVEFTYRRKSTSLSDQLDAAIITSDVEQRMEATFVDQMAELLLFTRAIDSIVIQRRDGSVRRATRIREQVSPTIDRLLVTVEGAAELDCEFLTVRATIDDPPAGRHGRVTAALPISDRHYGAGRAFFMFPTETDSGLGLSIDAHFRATDDRRSLENVGEHGKWNERIFAAAGQAVGEALETVLDPDVHGLSYESAVGWFAEAGSAQSEVKQRANQFLTRLDAEARYRRVIPDRSGEYRLPGSLACLPAEIEDVLAATIVDTAEQPKSATTRRVYARWGLETWSARQVADWLSAHVPHVPLARGDAPEFMRLPDGVLRVLDFCRGQEATLQGVALLLGTDDTYYPIGGPLAKPSADLKHLLDGLDTPLVAPAFESSLAARYAPKTTPQWFHTALLASADRLVGRKVPIRSIGAASKQQHVSEALSIVRRVGPSLVGLPLAMDEDAILHAFDDLTVVGLPDGRDRKNAVLLARRLGYRPLHRTLDDEHLAGAALKFSVSLIAESIPVANDWNPVADSRLLVEVLGSIAQAPALSSALIEQLREIPIWMGSDGRAHPLSELRLPARDRIVRTKQVLVADDLVGDIDPSAVVYSTLHGLLGVDVLDTTEEVVMNCERPPADPDDLRVLLEELADCARLSGTQVARLKNAPFVLCRDGRARRPPEVLLAEDDLPLDLGARSIDRKTGRDRKVRVRLLALGARELPNSEELLDTAAAIAQLPIASDQNSDPGRLLWDHLELRYEKYPGNTLGALATVPWVVSLPGPTRRKPKDCYDPGLKFAQLLYPVPMGVMTPRSQFRDALRIRATLETSDFIALARHAAEVGQDLPQEYFSQLNRRASRGDADEREIAALRSLPIIPIADDGPVAPERLVSPERHQIWWHLRSPVPPEFSANYPNLIRAWAIGAEALTWSEHLDVLAELAGKDALGERELRLARERVISLAEIPPNEHQLETIRQRGHLLTSKGLTPCARALRGDLPPGVMNRLRDAVPIAEESDRTAGLLDSLALTSLREAVRLQPFCEGQRAEEEWPRRLAVHGPNVLRFLKSAGARIDRELFEAWPPLVEGVASLSVQATIDGAAIADWVADAHLSHTDSGLTLYVRGGNLDTKAVVDAIAAEFGIDRGQKTLLRAVLESRTAEAGAKELDWENINPLSERETLYFTATDAPSLNFGEIDDEIATGDPASSPDRGHEDTEGWDPIDAIAASDSSEILATPDVYQEVEAEDTEISDRRQAMDRVRSPRGSTDAGSLEEQGFQFVADLDNEPLEQSYLPERGDEADDKIQDEVRLCLSFFDVAQGFVPLAASVVNRLASGVALNSLRAFGEIVSAAPHGDHHVRLVGGSELFYSRQVVPGTVVRARPSVPGVIELEFRPDVHSVDGVWMLELDGQGNLTRLRQDDVELQWETDDAFYRAERRLEDIEALMADGGKSALQLVIEAFQARPEEGLTADEVWGLVAISRLFANSTINNILSVQSGLFEHRDGLWYLHGSEIRRTRGQSTANTRASRSSTKSAEPELLKTARRLASMLQTADDDAIDRVVQLLGIKQRLQDAAFRRAVDTYLRSEDPELLEAIGREVSEDLGRSLLAVEMLERLDLQRLTRVRPLAELLTTAGSGVAVARARELILRLDASAGIASGTPLHRAQQLVDAFEAGGVSAAVAWDAIAEMWRARPGSDPLAEPGEWVRALTSRELLHRRAAGGTDATDEAQLARSAMIGWLGAQLTVESYDSPALQQLRVVQYLLAGAEFVDIVDGLHQLALLAEAEPGASGDAALMYSLVVSFARNVGVQSKIVSRSEEKLAELARDWTDDTYAFAERWSILARVPLATALTQLS
jgi:hypothetical protein